MIDNSQWGTIPISGVEMFECAVQSGALNTADMMATYWSLGAYDASQGQGTPIQYSNPSYSMLGELVRIKSGLAYSFYVSLNILAPLGLEDDIYPDRGHRYLLGQDHPPLAAMRSYLINDDHPYDPQSSNPIPPLMGVAAPPSPVTNRLTDGSPGWAENTGPIDPLAPPRSAYSSYAGSNFVGGAPLAAGGWHGTGEALGHLIRQLNRTDNIMPANAANTLWSPQWWNQNHFLGLGWSYCLGWYARGNWVAMAGGASGGMAVVLHSRYYDVTIVYMANISAQRHVLLRIVAPSPYNLPMSGPHPARTQLMWTCRQMYIELRRRSAGRNLYAHHCRSRRPE